MVYSHFPLLGEGQKEEEGRCRTWGCCVGYVEENKWTLEREMTLDHMQRNYSNKLSDLKFSIQFIEITGLSPMMRV